MIARIGRLTAAEALKLSSHPFFYVALLLVVAATVVPEFLYTAFQSSKETPWRSWHAVHLFAVGFQVGLKLSTYVLLVFAGMLVAGEFDRGTIKNLLTRPVTRTDFFLSKCLTLLGLSVLLFGLVLYAALVTALARGVLGPVWDDTQYLIMKSETDILWYARHSIALCLPSFLAAGFLGFWVSTWTESSGYAVAIALVLFLFGDLATGWLRESHQEKLFFYYPSYATAKLLAVAQGEGWTRDAIRGLPYIRVPALYIAAFAPAAYGLFRFKNIHS